MRRCLVPLAALCFTLSANAADTPFKRFPPDYTFDNGRILAAKTIKGETKYEYSKDGKLARKVFPKGGTVDFYYDRAGKPTEVRFSTGLIRTFQYDRAGKLLAIVGSDGYTKTIRGPKGERVLILTGPNNFKMDLTSQARKAALSMAAAIGMRPRAMVEAGGPGGVDCGDWFAGFDYRDCYSSGESGGGGGDGDGGGAGDTWGGDGGAGGYGDDAGYTPEDDEDSSGSYGEEGGEGTDPIRPPERGAPSGNFAYDSCMGWVCIPANQKFRNLCAGGAVPAEDKVECNTAATRAFLNCEAECRYKSY